MKTLLEKDLELEDLLRKDVNDRYPHLDADLIIRRSSQKRLEAAIQLNDILKGMWPQVHTLIQNPRGLNVGS